MSTHTPGPWTYDNDSKWVVSGWFGIHQVPMGNVNSQSEHLANARLIAAAPRMLEALEVVPDFLADSATWAKWNDMRRAAIAQARGETND